MLKRHDSQIQVHLQEIEFVKKAEEAKTKQVSSFFFASTSTSTSRLLLLCLEDPHFFASTSKVCIVVLFILLLQTVFDSNRFPLQISLKKENWLPAAVQDSYSWVSIDISDWYSSSFYKPTNQMTMIINILSITRGWGSEVKQPDCGECEAM